MQEPGLIFEERQYLGHNRLSIIWRMVIAVFCFIGYYWSVNPEPVQIAMFNIGAYPIHISNSGRAFFLLGLLILIISAVLIYIMHMHVRVYKGYMIIDGFGAARRVKIDFSTIESIRKSRYKKNIFRRAVYNLHYTGIIRFYTYGEDFVDLKDATGFVYRIGSQRAHELYNAIESQIKFEKFM